MNDPATSPAVRRTARPFDADRALELLRAGWPAYKVRREVGVRTARILDLAKRNGITLGRGPRPAAFDEARALELLRSGMPAYKVRAAVGCGSLRKIVRLARAAGIAIRDKKTKAELARLDSRVRACRESGLSWSATCRKLGFRPGALAGVRRRACRMHREPAVALHEKRFWAILRRLCKINPCSKPEDVASFTSMAGRETAHWLLLPQEIELARRFRLLPERCMNVPADELRDRSLRMKPLYKLSRSLIENIQSFACGQ